MPNLITLSDSTGLIGSCGRNCYEGKPLTNPCICLGSNYGIGLTAAALNTILHHRNWTQYLLDRRDPQRPITVQLHPDLYHFLVGHQPYASDEA